MFEDEMEQDLREEEKRVVLLAKGAIERRLECAVDFRTA